MGISNWIFKRLFNDENLGYAIEKVKPYLREAIHSEAKELAIKLLEDEDIAYGVNQYSTALGDHLFARYKKKFFTTLGGMQKGINYAVAGATNGGENPILGVLQGGEIDLTKIVTSFLLGQFQKRTTQTFQGTKQIPDRFKVR